MNKQHILGFFDDLVRTPVFLFLCAMFLCGAAAGGLTGLRAGEGDGAAVLSGLLAELPAHVVQSTLCALIWVLLPLVCAFLRPRELLLLSGCALPMPSSSMVSMDELPAYSDSAYVEIDGNQPSFTDADKQETEAFEEYSDLDYLGRCGTAYANVGQELMPADGEKRGSIGQVKPTGWHTVKYDCVDGKYLYNRCHLIGWQLTAENANKQNLITGTRYLNIEGMLPFENMVADYVKETGNHVLYRVTPVFEGSNLVASGVQMEAWSVEDDGEGICFNVYCYNVQPGVEIDYASGESQAA